MDRSRAALRKWVLLGAMGMTACSGRKIDLGGSNDTTATMSPSASSGGTTSSGAPGSYGGFPGASPCRLPPPPTVDAGPEAGAYFAPLAGTWTGYIETASNLTLAVTPEPDGSVSGSVTFGSGAPPPPPTSKSEAYPPAPDSSTNGLYPYTFPWAGFAYSAVDTSFDGTRLQLGVVQNEIFEPWCALQTSYDWFPNGPPTQCGCLPNWAGMGSLAGSGTFYLDDPVTSAPVPVTTAQWNECTELMACSCTSAGCAVDMTRVTSRLDVQLASNRLDGSITWSQGNVLNVHLTKSP